MANTYLYKYVCKYSSCLCEDSCVTQWINWDTFWDLNKQIKIQSGETVANLRAASSLSLPQALLLFILSFSCLLFSAFISI